MVLVEVRERDEDHEHNRQHREKHERQHRKREQRDMEALVEEGLHIRDEGIGLDSPLRLLLYMQRAPHVDGPDRNKWNEGRQRQHAEQQNEHGVVTRHTAENLRRLVPYARLRIGAQRAEVLEILPAKPGLEPDKQCLKGHQQKTLDHLPPLQLAKTHDQRGQPRPHISLAEDFRKGRKPAEDSRRTLFRFALRHRQHPFFCALCPSPYVG